MGACHEYTIQYRPGKEHMDADYLSRLPLPAIEVSDPEDRVLIIEDCFWPRSVSGLCVILCWLICISISCAVWVAF